MDANIAIPTGTPSGWLVVDVDPRNGGDKTWEALMVKHGLYPVCPEQATGGGGRHYIFKDPGVKTPSTLGPGIDLKSTGGYILVAPSVTDKEYQFDDPKKLLALPAAPEWMYRAPSKESLQPEKGRNQTLTALAGLMRNIGMSVPEIRAALGIARIDRFPGNALPMDEIEDTILRSAAKWEQGRIACAELLKRYRSTTAIVAANDLVALASVSKDVQELIQKVFKDKVLPSEQARRQAAAAASTDGATAG